MSGNTQVTPVRHNVWQGSASGPSGCGVVMILMVAGMLTTSAPAQEERTEAEKALVARLIEQGIDDIEPNMTINEVIDVAMDASRSRKLKQAQTILEFVAANDRRNLRAMYSLGNVYVSQSQEAKSDPVGGDGAREAAIRFLNLAVRLYLNEAIPLALELGDLRGAGDMYKTILVHRPDNAQAQLGLARVYARMGRGDLAIERYNTYINPNSNLEGHQDSQAHLELARLYRARRYLNQAIQMLQEAKRLNPENPEILTELAAVYMENNRGNEALELARTAAVVKAPENPACREIYAEILLKLSQVPAVGTDRLEKARTYRNQADEQAREAIRLAENQVSQNPGDIEPLNRLQSCYRIHTDVLTELLRAAPNRANLGVRIELARATRTQADIARRLKLHGALAALAAVGNRGDRDADFLLLRAELELVVGKNEAAARTCGKLLRLQPDSEIVKQLIGQLPEELRPTPGSLTTAPSSQESD